MGKNYSQLHHKGHFSPTRTGDAAVMAVDPTAEQIIEYDRKWAEN